MSVKIPEWACGDTIPGTYKEYKIASGPTPEPMSDNEAKNWEPFRYTRSGYAVRLAPWRDCEDLCGEDGPVIAHFEVWNDFNTGACDEHPGDALLTGTTKWDGCSDINGQVHICGPEMIAGLAEALQLVYALADEMLGHGEYERPVVEHFASRYEGEP